MTLTYLWSKFMKNLPRSATVGCSFEKPSKLNAQSSAVNATMGRYSYCGYGSKLFNCKIGRFCSVSDNVCIGLASHPMEWVSTSPAFHFGRGSIPKDLAAHNYQSDPPLTVIGNDVWIGQGALIKPGITIGDGAVIAMGSVVTKDVPPYAVVGGNPAKIIKMRFSEELIQRLLASKWWDLPPEKLKEYAPDIQDPERFLERIEKLL